MVDSGGFEAPRPVKKTPLWRQVFWPRSNWSKVCAIGGWLIFALFVLGTIHGRNHVRPGSSSNGAARACLRWENAPAASKNAQDVDPAEVIRAMHLLRDCFIDPVDSRDLLTAAWDGARETALKAGTPPDQIVKRPQFAGIDDDERMFLSAFDRLTAAAAPHISHDELVWSAISTMAWSLHEQHTSYAPPSYWQNSERSGAVEVPEVGYRQTSEADGSMVWEVIPGSAAAKAGLHPGDVITAVDGLAIYGREPLPVPRLGQSYRLTVKRGDSTLDLLDTPERQGKRLTVTQLPGDVAYVRLYNFAGTANAFQRDIEPELAKFQDHPPEAWILDLRNNPGGKVEAAQYFAHRFGLSGNLIKMESRFNWSYGPAPGANDLVRGAPLVILVNELSASAGEITAAAFQDSGQAWIVGTRTRGSANSSFDSLVAGGGLAITTERVYIASSHRRVDGVGVTPDDVVRNTPEGLASGHDAQLEHALAYLRSLSQTPARASR